MSDFIKIMFRLLAPYKKYVVLSVVCSILSAILNVFSFAGLIPILNILFKTGKTEAATALMPWSWGNAQEVVMNNMNYYVNQLSLTNGPVTALFFIGLILAVLTLLKTGMYFLSSCSLVPLRTGVVRDLRNQIYRKITGQSLGFFSEERKGDIIARMSGDVNEVEVSVMASLEMLFKDPILIIVYFSTLLFLSWELTIFTLIIVPLMGWAMGAIGRKLKRRSMKTQTLLGDTMSQVEETLGGLRIIKAFCAEEKMNNRFAKTNEEYRRSLSKVQIRQTSAHPVSEFLGTLLIVIVLWFGGMLVLNTQTIDGSTFIYYLIILYSIINPLKQVSKAGYSIPKGMASMERIDKILLSEVSIKEAENAKTITSFEKEIELRNVWFGYRTSPGGEPTWVLKDINLVIPKGKTIALVGQSGGGKSTLVDLIPRFYDVQRGEVLIDGVNVKELSINSLRQLIGNVNQEAILFNDTFRNNIAFSIPDPSDNDQAPSASLYDSEIQQRIEQAAKIANAYDFIVQSEHGFDTRVGDRGSRLSGGQRQRISIARAILKNPPILILDEATSALDTESERLVQDALEKLMKTRTTIAIAHRLSTIRNADEICVLHDGRIVERGTHAELQQLNGYYRKLNDMQNGL